MLIAAIAALCAGFWGVTVSAQWNTTNGTTLGGQTYTNPILNGVGADPWVTQDGGYYYMTYSLNDNITLFRTKTLTNWNTAESKLLFLPPPGEAYSTDIWAPEIHNIDGRWYVIFTADPNYDTPPPQQSMYCDYDCPAVNHRMYVLESSGGDIWESTYELKGELDTFDQFAIDGTYFRHSTGLYHVYSCWYAPLQSWPSMLCITKLSNPYTTLSNLTDRTIISAPTQPWEKTPYGRTQHPARLASNEGPEQLTNPFNASQTYIVYSAARSDNPNYCLGLLELVGPDPMNAGDWRKDEAGCVFWQDKLAGAYGVGHASFVRSPDGGEAWVMYHGMEDAWSGWGARTIRTQRFAWDEAGRPVFPRPGYGPYEVPSGQLARYT